MNTPKNMFEKIYRNSLVHHLFFWGSAFICLIFLFKVSIRPQKIDFIYTIAFIAFSLNIGLLNTKIFIPYFLQKERYLNFSILSISNLIATSFLCWLFLEKGINRLFSGYYFISYFSFWNILGIQAIFLGLTTLFKLSKNYLFVIKEQKELMEQQLHALRSQVNPHFLFNQLNGLYALTLKNDPQTPSFILKLSDILRYMIYEADTPTISLKREIRFLKYYLQLQQLRQELSGADITFEIRGAIKDQQIAPLLFIPLVENSFKHGLEHLKKKGFLYMALEATHKNIHFLIRNSSPSTFAKETHKGIGLQNLQNRLTLLYPNKHQLVIQKDSHHFEASLTVIF